MASTPSRRTLLTASLAGVAAASLTAPAEATAGSARGTIQRIDEIVAAIQPLDPRATAVFDAITAAR